MDNINSILDSVFNEMMDSLKNDPKYLEMLINDTPIADIHIKLEREHFGEDNRLYINPDIRLVNFRRRFSSSRMRNIITKQRGYVRRKARDNNQIEQLPSNFVVAIFPLGKSEVELAPETEPMSYLKACRAAKKLTTWESVAQGIEYSVYEISEDGSYIFRR